MVGHPIIWQAGLFIAKVAQWLGAFRFVGSSMGINHRSFGKSLKYISKEWKKPMVHVRNGRWNTAVI